MPMLAELSGAVTVCSWAAGSGCPPAAEPELPPFDALALLIAPPGCHSPNSSFSMGFTVLPNRDASSDTSAASTCFGPFIAARTRPATLAFPAGWFATVKKTPTVSVPRNLRTRPICGRSPQLACTARNTEAMPPAWLAAPSTTPYMILPPSGELTDFRGACAAAHHALTVKKLKSNPASFQRRVWIRIATTSSSFISHPQRNLAGFLQQDFEELYRAGLCSFNPTPFFCSCPRRVSTPPWASRAAYRRNHLAEGSGFAGSAGFHPFSLAKDSSTRFRKSPLSSCSNPL